MANLRASRRKAVSLGSRISVVYRPIDQLTRNPANPRVHSKKQIGQIAESIRVFGFNVPVLVAAERTGQRCYGVELDRVYADGNAHQVSSGRSFDDLAVEAEAANAV
jgi:hypothetical protein